MSDFASFPPIGTEVNIAVVSRPDARDPTRVTHIRASGQADRTTKACPRESGGPDYDCR